MKALRFDVFYYLLGVLIVIVLVYSTGLDLREEKGYLLGNWIEYETTEGEIILVDLFFEYTGGPGHHDAVNIEYVFNVEGQTYYSDLINFAGDKREVEHYSEKYPVGRKVVVFYEKNNPEFAVLEPENKAFRVVRGPLMILMFFIGYLFVGFFCQRYRWCARVANIKFERSE